MRKTKRVWMSLLLMVLLLTACSRPVDDHHDHDHSHPWETNPVTAPDKNHPSADLNTPVTGTVSRFLVWNANDRSTASSASKEPELRVISTLDQWKAYCQSYYPDFLTKYDNGYFQNHSVVIYRKVENSSSTDLSVIDTVVKDEKLVILIRRQEPFLQDTAMKSWCLFIEVEGDVTLDEDSDAVLEFLKAKS